jgi:hypothetical protein
MDIPFSYFQTWINSLPENTTFDFGNVALSLEARFLASVANKHISVYIPPADKGLVYSGTLDVSWPEDHWFSMLARFSYNNRIKTLAQAKEFLEFAARLDIR